jgi:hypothetical protein
VRGSGAHYSQAPLKIKHSILILVEAPFADKFAVIAFVAITAPKPAHSTRTAPDYPPVRDSARVCRVPSFWNPQRCRRKRDSEIRSHNPWN